MSYLFSWFWGEKSLPPQPQLRLQLTEPLLSAVKASLRPTKTPPPAIYFPPSDLEFQLRYVLRNLRKIE